MDIMPPETKRARCRQNSWSDLPEELLSVILDRLPPALGDRIRFRGVCQAWRAAELAHPRPPKPWLVVPGYCVSLHGAAIHRIVLPEDACAAACRGSFGDWLALVPPNSGRRAYLLNAFTMARIKLPRWTGEPIDKIILSSAPETKSGCTVAAVVHHHPEYSDKTKIVVCRLGGGRGQSTWWRITDAFELRDIIFFEGKLHALDGDGCVHAFEDAELERLRNKRPWKEPVGELTGRFYDDPKLHLVALHGKLCMVGRCFGDTCVPGGTYYTCAVGVFALPLPKKRPPPVKDFNGHAVFDGDACRGAFPVAAAGGKIRVNQICFVDDEKNLSSLSLSTSGQRDARRPLRALQSYDARHRCVRTYQPRELTQPWRCVAAQRFPNKRTMGPPPLTTPSWPELLLWTSSTAWDHRFRLPTPLRRAATAPP